MSGAKSIKMADFIETHLLHDKLANAAVFSLMRILKARNPGDTYYENYLWHFKKREEKFVDYYHLLWHLGSKAESEIGSILEIGCRTGISLCQLLAPMQEPEKKRIVLFDIFNDGFISPEIVKMNLKYLGLPTDNVKFSVGSSLETIPAYQGEPFDYVLVDGCHDKPVARQDLENCVRLVNPGGLLFFDDIAMDGCDLKDVWEDFKAAHKGEFIFLEDYHGKGIGVGIRAEEELI